MRETLAAEGMIPVRGGRVWYRIAGQERAGVPLLVLHGGPGAPHDYLEPLAALADERPVIFYDQLGCGNSDRPDDPSLWNTARFVDELAAWAPAGNAAQRAAASRAAIRQRFSLSNGQVSSRWNEPVRPAAGGRRQMDSGNLSRP